MNSGTILIKWPVILSSRMPTVPHDDNLRLGPAFLAVLQPEVFAQSGLYSVRF